VRVAGAVTWTCPSKNGRSRSHGKRHPIGTITPDQDLTKGRRLKQAKPL